MWGYDLMCKDGYSYGSLSLDQAYDCIQLNEDHEAGEIINKYWLIKNDTIQPYQKLKKGDYAQVIDIRFFEIFETDINYDNRNDLKKYGTSTRLFNNHVPIIINNYGYVREVK